MDIELIRVMIIRDDDDGIRTARAFATQDAAIRAMLIAAEKESDRPPCLRPWCGTKRLTPQTVISRCRLNGIVMR